ncbi:MAG TPA: dephospho-CoA kinase, partial [Opitutaceae bacterium]
MVLGITGGFGCGKSTAAKLFTERGFRHLDADQVIRERVFPNPGVTSALQGRYGSKVFGEAGAINRVSLASIVFTDDAERLWLEELTHPGFFEIARSELRAHPGAKWVLEVPLLFEKSLENWFDFTVCVA